MWRFWPGREKHGKPDRGPGGGGFDYLSVHGAAAPSQVLRELVYGYCRLDSTGPVQCHPAAPHQAHGPLPGAGAGRGGPHLARPGLKAGGAPDLPGGGHRPGQGAGLERLCRLRADLQPGDPAVDLCHAAAAVLSAPEPPGVRRGGRGPVLQHRGQFHHQHQLAELRRREHHVVPVPDGGPGLPQLLLRRPWASPWPRPW